MTIDEVFELQRLQSEHRSTAEARDAASFMTAHILPIIRELNDTRAKCSALKQNLKCARTGTAGYVVSARPGVVRAIAPTLEGQGFHSERSYQRHLQALEDNLRATYPSDEMKQAHAARMRIGGSDACGHGHQLSGCVLDLRSVSQFLRMMPG